MRTGRGLDLDRGQLVPAREAGRARQLGRRPELLDGQIVFVRPKAARVFSGDGPGAAQLDGGPLGPGPLDEGRPASAEVA